MFEDMFIAAMVSQKGGPGKTTLGMNLAKAAAEHGYIAVVIDLDPQATAANWKDRSTFENPAVVSVAPSRLRQTLEAAQQNAADFVIVDSPGKADNIAITAATYADVVLVPVYPRMSNFETLPGVHTLIQAAQGKTPPSFVVLNTIHPSATTSAETLKRMVAEAYPQIPVCPLHITDLDVYGTSQDVGKTVFDYDDPKGKRAAEEIRQLYKFVISQSHKLDNSHGSKQTRKPAKRA
jgi:chromosome partitioning protein